MMSFVNVQAASCVSLTTNLQKGTESSVVLSLQTFLYAKGILKATPNGYFGPATLNAVKIYQKNNGLSQVGNTGPATRAAIKKETCNVPVSNAPTACTMDAKMCPGGSYVGRTGPNCAFAACPPVQATSSQSINQAIQAPVAVLPKPYIDSIDKMTFISGGIMTASLTLHGNGFSTSSNTITLRLQNANRTYTVGSFPSSDGLTLAASSTFTNTPLSCGMNCLEIIPQGVYEVTVTNKGGESNIGYISIKTITTRSVTGTTDSAIKQQSKQSLLGTIYFTSLAPVTLETINLIFEGAPALTNMMLKDELTGETIGGLSSFSLGKKFLAEGQGKTYSIYADVNTPVSASVTASGSLEVTDFIGKNLIKVAIPSFLFTISG